MNWTTICSQEAVWFALHPGAVCAHDTKTRRRFGGGCSGCDNTAAVPKARLDRLRSALRIARDDVPRKGHPFGNLVHLHDTPSCGEPCAGFYLVVVRPPGAVHSSGCRERSNKCLYLVEGHCQFVSVFRLGTQLRKSRNGSYRATASSVGRSFLPDHDRNHHAMPA